MAVFTIHNAISHDRLDTGHITMVNTECYIKILPNTYLTENAQLIILSRLVSSQWVLPDLNTINITMWGTSLASHRP